jgi:hypothetical protein
MTRIVKTVALIATGIVLSGFGYNAYTANQNNQVDRIACTTVSTKDAVLSVERDLLTRQHTELFGKYRITIGSILFHNEAVEKNGTRVIVPFLLSSSRRGQTEYRAEVRCSDLSSIEYSKL